MVRTTLGQMTWAWFLGPPKYILIYTLQCVFLWDTGAGTLWEPLSLIRTYMANVILLEDRYMANVILLVGVTLYRIPPRLQGNESRRMY